MVVVGSDTPFAVDDLKHIRPLSVAVSPRLVLPIEASGPLVSVPLWKVAFGRSGDKGDSANIGIVARTPEWYPYLLQQLNETTVRQYLRSLSMSCSQITRFELPKGKQFSSFFFFPFFFFKKVLGMNFLVENVLGGGGGSSLLYDKQGKTFAARLLQMQVRVPAKGKL
jgi:hypothetical protein